MRTPQLAARLARAGRGEGAPGAALLARLVMCVAGAAVGAVLVNIVGRAGGPGDATLARHLQGDGDEDAPIICATGLSPVRNGSFETKGIAFCDDANVGALIFVCLFFMVYSFWALAIVVDEGFVTVLDFIVQELAINEDVAGATFMAAGGSAPEFFTNLISTFEQSDTGFGTIVGSAVFNILFVISMSAFFSRPREEVVRRRKLREEGVIVTDPWHFEPLPLTWWPLLRDSVSYVAGLIVLAIFYYCFHGIGGLPQCSSDFGFIEWYESLILFLMYVGYCTAMGFQKPLRSFVERKLTFLVPVDQRQDGAASSTEVAPAAKDAEAATDTEATAEPKTTEESPAPAATPAPAAESDAAAHDDEHHDHDDHGDEEEHESALEKLKKRASVSFDPDDVRNKRVSFNALGRRGLIINEDIETLHVPHVKKAADESSESGASSEANIDVVVPRMRPLNWKGDPEKADNMPYRVANAVAYGLVLPIVGAIKTIGFNYDSLNAMENRTKRRAAATYAFFMSLFWIAVFTWVMVYASESVAATWGIPEVILGFTILAAGTSTPDMLSSVFVAQLGYGDMAVSSSIGSNIFDILVGLPIPWLLKASVDGEPVAVPTGAIGVSLTVIILMMISLVGIIIWQGWKLTKTSAWAMLVLYFVFILAVCIPEATK